MPQNSLPVAFVRQYETDVHVAYQRNGSKLRGMVRTKTGVRGSTVQFPKFGTGAATQKSRHGEIVPMNVDHSNVEAVLQDWYAGSWNDQLDNLKTNINERQLLINSGAYALGRRSDKMITDALDSASGVRTIGNNSEGLTRDKILDAFTQLNEDDVPDDGRRFAIVGAKQWTDLLKIPEFADADYVGDTNLPWLQGATQVKAWLGMWWMMFTGLPKEGDVRDTFMFHGDAVGHAIQQEIISDITWHGDRASWFINNMMAQAAVLIDEIGVVRIPALEA